ncbi:MAG: hypothetical protein JSS66_16445 [Armatimonadetes bacterium]|nr:hypothetical protein [Armatimonadota bacterium]
MKALLSLSTALLASSAFGQVWTDLGPSPISGGTNGRVSAIACSGTDPNKYYVGGADGGVWKTTDGGVTWNPMTNREASSAVGAIALDPNDDNIVYVGTGEANYANHSRYGVGVLKSMDGGSTWTLLGNSSFAGRTISKIVINPQNTQEVYAAVAAAGGFPEKAGAKGHPLKDGPMGVFKSTDGGATWSQLLNGLPNQAGTDVAIVPSSPNIVFAAIGRPFGATENGIYRSTDSGASWSKLAGGLPTANLGRISVATAPNNASRVYALVVNRCDASGNNGSTLGGYRSMDGGNTWTSVPVGSFQATYGWYLCAVGVQPTNADVAVYAGYDLLRSTNGGTSFSTVTTQHVDNHAVAWDASGRLLCGNDGGIFRSTNNGTSWSNLNTGLGITQFYAAISIHPTDTNLVLGGLQDNSTAQRIGSTKTWTSSIGGDGGYTAIDQANPLREFAQYQGAGNLFRSTNGGGSWGGAGSGINAGDRSAFFSPVEIDPTNSNRMLLGTYRVYRSLNGGTSWSVLSGDLSNGAGSIRALAISASNPSTVWVATTDGNVSKSTDGGATFARKLQSIPGWPRVTREITIDPSNDQIVYLAVSNFGTDQIRRSLNGGDTWQTLDGNLPDVPVNVIAVTKFKGKRMLFVGTDTGVYRSLDDGVHWSPYGTGLPTCCVIDIKIDTAHNRMVVGTQGRGAWSIVLSQSSAPTTGG